MFDFLQFIGAVALAIVAGIFYLISLVVIILAQPFKLILRTVR